MILKLPVCHRGNPVGKIITITVTQIGNTMIFPKTTEEAFEPRTL